MMRANPLGLHRSSPHGRYVSAAGITVADMDVFVMRRFHADHVKGNWALLRPVGVEGGLEGPEKALRQHCEVPYGLTRIFFTNFHNVLPHIWEGIGARRREILWTAWLRGVARPLVDAVAVSTAERRQYGEDMKHAAGSGGSTTESDEGALFFLKPLANVLTHNGLFLRFVMCSVIKSLEEMASGTRGCTNLSIGAWCNKLTEVVYSGALALCCMIGSSSSGGDANADPVLTGDKMEGKTTTPQACKGASREEAQRDLAVLQQHLSGAITRLLANLTTKDVAIVERLLRTLCELRLDSLCEEGMLRGILGQLAQLCNAQTCEPLYQWLEQQENSRSGAPEPLLEPLLCEWQRAASEADAGIPVRLPTVMECCRGVFGILKKRGYRLPDGAEGKQPPSEVQTGEEKTDDNLYEGRPIGMAFTKGELAVVITVFSRAIIGRTFVLDGVRVWRTISGEISTLVASRSDEKDTASSSGAGRTATESRAASDAVSVNASAAQRAVLLEGMLSRAVTQLMEELPWTTVLEAVHLQLLPYTAAEVLFSCSKGVEGNEAEHIQWQDLQRSFQRKRHHRLVGKMVLFRFYSYLAPHDEGWSDATVLLRSASAEGRGRHISPPGAATWRLLKTLVECETAGVWGRRGNEAAVPAAKLSTDAEHGSDPVQGEELRLRQLDYVLGSHTLAAYIVLMASGKAPHMPRSAYETLLTLIEKAALTASPVSNNHCDLLFLWMVGSAVAVGVHFKEGVLTIKWPAASEGSVEDLQVCTSMEEETARVVRLLEPHLQTEMMRPTVRLRSIINIVVALRTLVLLGAVVDVDSMHFEQLLIKAGSDKRLLVRHVNLFLVGCSAFPRTQPALLHTALYLREARQNLSIAETERALVAIALSADSFAKQHGLQADHTQQKQLNNASSLTPVSGSGALTFRVTPIQLRHAWSALGRHVLECAEGSPTTVFVRALQCAAAVGCVDTVVYQQLLSYMVEFRQSELTLFDWVVILQTARQSLEHQRSLEAYLQEPLRSFLMEMSGGCDTVGEPKRQWCTRRECGSEQWLQELCLFAEALPELFIGDASLWELLWRALSAQWSACFSAAGSDEEKERISGWLQELTESYTWAVRTAGHHNLSEMCAV
uniref:Uncharacterized protein TCIL3000_11_9510 n=1 Tax=Trypanosoma congolense (strain IL3000) TaxID=1068625 RepID=G0V1G5_TRYCI|nr:unnamed protein product [Trypanosoma congolense IL3000]